VSSTRRAVAGSGQPPVYGTYLGDASFGPSSGQPGYPNGGGSTTGTTTGTTTTTSDTGAGGLLGGTGILGAGLARLNQLVSRATQLGNGLPSLTTLENQYASQWWTDAGSMSAASPEGPSDDALAPFGMSVAAATYSQLATEFHSASTSLASAIAGLSAGQTGSARRATAAGDVLGSVVKPAAVRLTLPAGHTEASRRVDQLLAGEATVVSDSRAQAITVHRCVAAIRAHRWPDARRQLTALARYDRMTAGAVMRLAVAQQNLARWLIAQLRRDAPSSAAVQAAARALAHPSRALRGDARRLHELTALRQLRRAAQTAAGAHRAAAISLLSRTSARSVSVARTISTRLDRFARLAASTASQI
jgi:hypothetical protein